MQQGGQFGPPPNQQPMGMQQGGMQQGGMQPMGPPPGGGMEFQSPPTPTVKYIIAVVAILVVLSIIGSVLRFLVFHG